MVAALAILGVLAGGGAFASISVSNRLASAKRDLIQKIERSSSDLDNKVAGIGSKAAAPPGAVHVATAPANGDLSSTDTLVVAQSGTAPVPGAALTVKGDSAFLLHRASRPNIG